jgi:hypothetical protein
VSVRCAVRGLLVCAVLGDTCHDADAPLCWVGIVVPCVSVRACVCCDGTLVGLRKCEESWLLAVVGGRVCNAAPPLCVTTVTSMLSVQCSGVCSCGAVCLEVCVYVAL